MKLIKSILFIMFIKTFTIYSVYGLEYISPQKLVLSFSKNDLRNYIDNMHIKDVMFDLSFENKLNLYKNIKMDYYHYSQLGTHEKIFLLELRNATEVPIFKNLTPSLLEKLSTNWRKLNLDEKEYALPHKKIKPSLRVNFLIEYYISIFGKGDYFPSNTLSIKPFDSFVLETALFPKKFMSVSMNIDESFIKEIQSINNKNSNKITDTVFSVEYKLKQELSSQTKDLLKEYIERLNTKRKAARSHFIIKNSKLTIGFNSHSVQNIQESFKELTQILNMPDPLITNALKAKLLPVEKMKTKRKRNCEFILGELFI